MKKTVDDFAFFGGKSVFDSFKTTMNLVVPDRNIFFKYAKASYTARQLTNNGPSVQELEHQLAKFHDVAHCIAFCNCFVGMQLALSLLALPKKEIIVPSLTYRRMADIIGWAGFQPRFCDVDPKTLAISPKTARECINENTAMILAPHPITNICDIEGMETLAAQHNLPLLFDSVEACGGTYSGKMIGGFGDCESFSMHPSKVFNSCEGGYITTNNSLLSEKLKKARTYGFEGKDHIALLGTNAKLNELHAAMGLATLSGIEKQLEANKKLHLSYQKALKDIPGIEVIQYRSNEKCNWKSLLICLNNNWPLDRKATLALLNAENIHARPFYSPAQHTTYQDQAGAGEQALPVTQRAVENHLILPFGSTVTIDDTTLVGDVFSALYNMHDAILERLQ